MLNAELIEAQTVIPQVYGHLSTASDPLPFDVHINPFLCAKLMRKVGLKEIEINRQRIVTYPEDIEGSSSDNNSDGMYFPEQKLTLLDPCEFWNQYMSLMFRAKLVRDGQSIQQKYKFVDRNMAIHMASLVKADESERKVVEKGLRKDLKALLGPKDATTFVDSVREDEEMVVAKNLAQIAFNREFRNVIAHEISHVRDSETSENLYNHAEDIVRTLAPTTLAVASAFFILSSPQTPPPMLDIAIAILAGVSIDKTVSSKLPELLYRINPFEIRARWMGKIVSNDPEYNELGRIDFEPKR